MRRIVTAILGLAVAGGIVLATQSPASAARPEYACAADFSWTKMAPARVKAVGCNIVAVYVHPTQSSGKYISRSQVASYAAAGIKVLPIYELSAQRAGGGYALGQKDAWAARVAAARLGIDDKTPIIAGTVDFDTGYANVKPYLLGVKSVLGWERTGIYGSERIITAAARDGVGRVLWQTRAWSRGRLSPYATMYQDRFAGAYDLNRVYVPLDWWGGTVAAAPATPSQEQVRAAPQVVTSVYAKTYVVRRGDTLSSIARRYGTTWQKLAALNRIGNPNRLRVGQVIKVAGVTPKAAPAAKVKPQINRSVYYKVRPGDSLSVIAKRYGTSAARIDALNAKIVNPNRVQAGWVIRVK